MSETEQQRLIKRQERLAKWKLKQAEKENDNSANPSTSTESGNTRETSESTTTRKEAETEGTSQKEAEAEAQKRTETEGTLSEPPQMKSSDLDQAKQNRILERQQRLEEWKRKKQAEEARKESASDAETARKQERLAAWKRKRAMEVSVPAIKIPTNKTPRVPTKKRVFMDEDNDDTPQPKFKVPTTAPTKAKEVEPEEDELDAFMSALESSEVPVSQAESIELPHVDEEDSDSEDSNSVPGSDTVIQAKLEKLQQEKDLGEVDHSTIDYAPFRKNFYTELEELSSLSEKEVAFQRNLDGIRVKGADVPAPVSKWAHLSLSPIILDVMKDILEFEKPTPIQAQALPALMSGRDFLGIAQTGSGKTLAFLLPLLIHVMDQPPLQKGDGPIAILLTPTRELAQQIYKQLSHFSKKLEISACCCYGGSPIEAQIAELKKGSQILVATPGRLIDLLATNNGKICNLRRVTYVVLDEADRMFDFGFEPQVNKVFSQVRPDCQKIFFSATFARKLEALVRKNLNNAVEAVVGGISIVAPEITQHVVLFEEDAAEASEIEAQKLAKLLEILGSYPHTKKLVFVEKQQAADSLLVQLLAHKMPCVTIHGGKEQVDRKYAIRDFSNPESGVDILIATSIAARGLDVKGLDVVINYDAPSHMEDYVHRVGRTGRAGRKGDAYTFLKSTQERPIADTVKALRQSHVENIDARLVEISDAYMEKLKSGTEKMSFGFGGRGLSKLDEARSTTQKLERKAYSEPAKSKAETPEPKMANLDLPEFKVISGKADETSGPDKGRFHSRVTINDLPQKARWVVVNRETLSRIIDATSTSITNKGQFYPPKTKVPTTIKKGGKETPAPPKLYLLIEGQTEQAVNEANRMIREKMIEGLEQTSQDDNASVQGKYTV